MPSLGGWEIVIIVAVLLLLFGAKKLPDMARSVGQSARVFKGEMKGLKEDDASKTQSQPETAEPTTPTPPAPLPQSQATVAQPPERPAGETTPDAQHGRTDAR